LLLLLLLYLHGVHIHACNTSHAHPQQDLLLQLTLLHLLHVQRLLLHLQQLLLRNWQLRVSKQTQLQAASCRHTSEPSIAESHVHANTVLLLLLLHLLLRLQQALLQ
jgi:hypothetical protein